MWSYPMQPPKNNNKALHKQVSSIFDGVPIPSSKQSTTAGTSASQSARSTGTRRPHWYSPNWQQNNPIQPGSASAPAKQKDCHKRSLSLGRSVANRLFGDPSAPQAKRQKIMAALVPVLLVVLAMVLVKVLNVPGRTLAEDTSTGLSASAGTASEQIAWKIPKPFPTDLPDPMLRVLGQSRAAEQHSKPSTKQLRGNLIVKGILYSADKPAAIVGTEIVHQGDQVYGVTVKKITPDWVEFELDGQTWQQPVQP